MREFYGDLKMDCATEGKMDEQQKNSTETHVTFARLAEMSRMEAHQIDRAAKRAASPRELVSLAQVKADAMKPYGIATSSVTIRYDDVARSMVEARTGIMNEGTWEQWKKNSPTSYDGEKARAIAALTSLGEKGLIAVPGSHPNLAVTIPRAQWDVMGAALGRSVREREELRREIVAREYGEKEADTQRLAALKRASHYAERVEKLAAELATVQQDNQNSDRLIDALERQVAALEAKLATVAPASKPTPQPFPLRVAQSMAWTPVV